VATPASSEPLSAALLAEVRAFSRRCLLHCCGALLAALGDAEGGGGSRGAPPGGAEGGGGSRGAPPLPAAASVDALFSVHVLQALLRLGNGQHAQQRLLREAGYAERVAASGGGGGSSSGPSPTNLLHFAFRMGLSMANSAVPLVRQASSALVGLAGERAFAELLDIEAST
jgi:hypothetical protein